ncbi:MAG: TonB-dependent receptor [Steroidobacteraceae bacterium]
MRSKVFLAANIAVLGFTAASSGQAQTTEAEQSSSGLEEIVVTAQRRAESLQTVPIAITAVTAAELSKQGISSTTDIASVTPGLTMTTQRNSVTPYLRGVGTQNGSGSEEGSVAMYVDGVYMASLSANAFAFNNIERIEVLRGPQGTLFGRNATGGLIHVITRDPQFETSGEVNAGYGNYDTSTGSLYVTGGLTDKIAADFGAYYSNQGDGWGENLNPAQPGDLNRRVESSYRSKVLFELSDETNIVFAADYSLVKNDQGNTRAGLPGAVLFGGQTFSGDIYDADMTIDRDTRSERYGASLRFTHAFSWANFSSLTAYRNAENYTLFDQDSTRLNVITAPITDVLDSWQQEFLLTGETGPLSWTGGLFYYDARTGVDTLSLRSGLIPSQNRDRVGIMKTKSYAGFAQGTYAFTDATSLTLGARYTEDQRELSGHDRAAPGFPVLAPGTIIPGSDTSGLPKSQTDRTFDKVTYRIALEHRFNPDVMAYASVSRGFKSGIFNSTTPLDPAVEPETLDAYEIGAKSELFDGTLRLNGAVFYYQYDDIQLTRINSGTTTLLNAAGGEVRGVDLEFILAPRTPVGNLTVSGGASYLDTEYTSFPDAPFLEPNPAGGNFALNTPGHPCPADHPAGSFAGNCNAKGNTMIRAPELSATVAVDYAFPVATIGELGFNVTAAYNDGFYWDADNRVKQPSYTLVNAQVSLTTLDEKWRVRLWSRNLTDEEYYITVSTSAGFGDAGAPGAPREYGVGLTYRF